MSDPSPVPDPTTRDLVAWAPRIHGFNARLVRDNQHPAHQGVVLIEVHGRLASGHEWQQAMTMDARLFTHFIRCLGAGIASAHERLHGMERPCVTDEEREEKHHRA